MGAPQQRHGINGDLAVYASKGKVFGWTALGLTYTVIGVAVAFLPSTLIANSVARVGLLLAVLGLFGSITARGLLMLLSSTPVLEVSHDGISLRSVFIQPGAIPWTDIRELMIRRSRLHTSMEIVLADPRQVHARQNLIQRLLCQVLQRSLLLSSHLLVISDSMLPMPIDDLLAQIQAHFPDELAAHGIRISRAG